ncbi:MAG TPA: hypothetical protein VGE42_06870, partial [Candidatus Dormibacteraeota bacterium]
MAGARAAPESRARWWWQTATAQASATSSGPSRSAPPSSVRTIRATCGFGAAPQPATASLT